MKIIYFHINRPLGLISKLSAIAWDESESTSEVIKKGLKRGFISGRTKLYSHKPFVPD
jgi:hypothetical protein